MRAEVANKVSQLQQCTVAEGLAPSQLQPLETLVFRKKKETPKFQKEVVQERRNRVQRDWLGLVVWVGARVSCETLRNIFPIGKHPFALCGCFLYTPFE